MGSDILRAKALRIGVLRAEALITGFIDYSKRKLSLAFSSPASAAGR